MKRLVRFKNIFSQSIPLVYISVIYILLYIPIVVFIVYSFNNATFSAVWHGATLKWYQTLLSDTPILRVTGHSLVIATLSSTIATFLGALASFALFEYRFHGKKLIFTLIFILIVVPDLMFGIALLVLYTFLKFPLGFWSLLLAHISFCFPFVIVITLSRLKDMDKNIFEAARDLGATDLMIFIRIIFPLLLPALIAGWLLSFTLSMDDVIISFFVSGPTYQILPLYIFSLVHVGVTPEINALCTVIFGLTLLVILLGLLIPKWFFVKK
ncbi:MAG: ABC transporter permease subunit [Gammaproteobacteria bacterium]|nr:ABC transporter permease subunit [Gammaproteobacteria bacterium]